MKLRKLKLCLLFY